MLCLIPINAKQHSQRGILNEGSTNEGFNGQQPTVVVVLVNVIASVRSHIVALPYNCPLQTQMLQSFIRSSFMCILGSTHRACSRHATLLQGLADPKYAVGWERCERDNSGLKKTLSKKSGRNSENKSNKAVIPLPGGLPSP